MAAVMSQRRDVALAGQMSSRALDKSGRPIHVMPFVAALSLSPTETIETNTKASRIRLSAKTVINGDACKQQASRYVARGSAGTGTAFLLCSQHLRANYVL